jgi:hypothetical protein
MLDEEEKPIDENINPESLESAIGEDDDFVEIEEEEVIIFNASEDDDLDIAFSHDDTRDWF